jgi:hypothetical protein
MRRGLAMKNSLFRGGYNDFKIEYCANCGTYLHIRLLVTIEGQKFKVCTDKCERELRAKHEVKEAERRTEQ